MSVRTLNFIAIRVVKFRIPPRYKPRLHERFLSRAGDAILTNFGDKL